MKKFARLQQKALAPALKVVPNKKQSSAVVVASKARPPVPASTPVPVPKAAPAPQPLIAVKKSGVIRIKGQEFKINFPLLFIYLLVFLYGIAIIAFHLVDKLDLYKNMPLGSSQAKQLTSKEVIQFLAKFTPCDVSDSLNNAGVANGGFIPNLINQSPVAAKTASAVGKAYTVLYAPKADPRPALKQSYIDEVPADAMVVIGLPLELQTVQAPYTRVNNALYGGLMSTRAQYRKAQGSVILGRIRDLDEHNALHYPVWSYGVGTSAPGPVVKVVAINVPLQVKVAANGDATRVEEILTINPGDYLIADKNGVVCLEDDDKLQSVLDYIPKRVEADSKVSEDIKRGKPAASSQKHWRGKI
ncbi:uncharacterized protein LODBEIA_P06330 [Lodderomyces beijingensis]|uniref:4-hydroxy-4-methyl-2-oxoglutarate aldolase n=1 Tax=Lodderomyces beijingensis TaxID=1775926 RepID=A0ABP0ZEX3_9ASCO